MSEFLDGDEELYKKSVVNNKYENKFEYKP